MPKKIHLTATVAAPIADVFDCLNDHQQFGEIWPGTARRVKDSTDSGNANGVGSEREIKFGPIPGLMIFREQIITCDKPTLLEYTAVGFAPIKNHLGRIEFTEEGGQTLINYSIELDSVIPCMTGKILKDLEKQWASGFGVLKDRLESAT
jgi:carbon monoxide dehydrogenase subunit G